MRRQGVNRRRVFGRVALRLLVASALAGLGVVAGLSLAGAPAALSAGFDFGDAPDGKPTGYGPAGRFPSLLASDGARAADTGYAFLGPQADREPNSRQVDRDRYDDGVTVQLEACTTSTAYLQVTLPSAGKPKRGRAYLNLFFDWNKDGSWGGSERGCGRPVAEWAVRNKPIDLNRQKAVTAIYKVTFPAGAQVDALWYRAILSVDEKWTSETGAGAIRRGEVEDYVRIFLVERYGARCKPDPLVIDHGKSGVIRIVPLKSSVPIKGIRHGLWLPNRARSIGAAGRNALRYTSKQVHGLPGGQTAVRDTVAVVVTFATTPPLKRALRCRVVVYHIGKRPPEKPVTTTTPTTTTPTTTTPTTTTPGAAGKNAAWVGYYTDHAPRIEYGTGRLFSMRVQLVGGRKEITEVHVTAGVSCPEHELKGFGGVHIHLRGGPISRGAKGDGFTTRGRRTFRTDFAQIFHPDLSKLPEGDFAMTANFRDWVDPLKENRSLAIGALRLNFTDSRLGRCTTGAVVFRAGSAGVSHTGGSSDIPFP